MKKSLIIGAIIFFMFSADASSDIVNDLKNFEKSLSEWVANFDKIDKRLSNLEGGIEIKDKQQAELNRSIANIEDLLTNLEAKIDNIGRTKSVAGVEKAIKSFEGTLDVFKNRFSEMAKRLEDQEVKTTVLEKIYKASQNPVETMMQAIDEQKKVISALMEKLDKQEKTILTIEESFKKQTLPDESLAKSIDSLNARISNLESGAVVVKKGAKKELKKAEEKVKEEGKKEAAALEDAVTEKGKIPAKEIPEEMKGLTDIGKGFFVKDVKFKKFGSSTSINGEIINKSDRVYSIADFEVQVYNRVGDVLGGHRFSINSFKSNESKKFEEIIVGVETESVAQYTIFLAEIPSFASAGEKEIKIINREIEVAAAEVKDILPYVEVKKITDEKEAIKPDELKDFEVIGNGFYAKKIEFAGFGSSSRVMGEVKNNSENDYQLVSFIMKVYSKDYGIITSFDFSIRRLKSGEIKPFEEIITGVRPFEVFRYEILFKNAY